MGQRRAGQGMRREIGYDVFASDDPHEQAMPFPNMGNNPLIPILGSCGNQHQSGSLLVPVRARQALGSHRPAPNRSPALYEPETASYTP